MQWRTIILILQQLKRRAHVGEERLLELRQFVRAFCECPGVALQHRLAQIFNRLAQGDKLFRQFRLTAADFVQRRAQVAV